MVTSSPPPKDRKRKRMEFAVDATTFVSANSRNFRSRWRGRANRQSADAMFPPMRNAKDAAASAATSLVMALVVVGREFERYARDTSSYVAMWNELQVATSRLCCDKEFFWCVHLRESMQRVPTFFRSPSRGQFLSCSSRTEERISVCIGLNVGRTCMNGMAVDTKRKISIFQVDGKFLSSFLPFAYCFAIPSYICLCDYNVK